MVTAPLGLVPRELEDFWPAAHYDIPVTGDWDVDELLVIREMVSEYARRNGFELIINHSGIEIEIPTIKILDTRQVNLLVHKIPSIGYKKPYKMQVKNINYQTRRKVFTDLRNSSRPHVFNTVPMNGWKAQKYLVDRQFSESKRTDYKLHYGILVRVVFLF